MSLNTTPQLILHRDRDKIVTVGLGMDVSGDTFTCQVRAESHATAPLICDVDVEHETDGTDGRLVLRFLKERFSDTPYFSGYLDIRRDSGGLTLAVFDNPLAVSIQSSVTP